MGVSLLDLNIFERKCLLTDINIKLCTRIENGVKQLLAIVTEEGNIVLHYNFGGLPPVLKHIPWFTDSEKHIQGICFDPSATWLLVTTTDVSLYIIPALNIVDPKQKIDCKWSLNDVTYFARHEKTPNVKPSCIIWWQTLDCNQNAILGHEDGTISFVSLTDGQNIGSCNISSPVKHLHICQDNNLDAVTLLITNISRLQWRLLLEQRSTAFIWSPDCGNKIQTAVEYAINGITNGHLDDSKTSRSRLQGLKQLSVEKLASLKQKLAETRARGISNNSKIIAEDQKSTGSNDSGSSQSEANIPEKLSHLCETFLCPQFARNRHLFSGYYKPSSILTIHGVDIDVIPMFVHKLFSECWEILVTDRFFFIVNEQLDCLSIVSCQYSECRLDGDNEFNEEALITQFHFNDNEKIIDIFKLSDLSINENCDESKKVQKTFVLAKSESELNIRKPKIDTCIIVTNRSVYKIGLGCSVIEKFVSLVTDDLILEKAERLAIMFGLSVQQLLEYSGDLLLSQERFKHAIALYRLSKCRILKSVLKFAVSGHCQELLSYITVCLSAANVEMSVSTKNHLSNLAIMSYTELLLRSSQNLLQKISNFKRFINFLAYNEYYDEVLAVNVVCQTALWSILTLLGRIRCLGFDIIEVLCKTLKNPPIDKSSSLKGRELDVISDSFHTCISDSMFLQCIVSKPQYSKIFLNYIKENLSNFNIITLKRLSNSLDPSEPVAWPIISKIFQKHKCHQSSSLDSTLDSMDFEPPDELLQSTHDLIETFICVLIVLIHKMESDYFNIDLLNLIEQPQDTIIKLKSYSPPSFAHPKPRILSSGYNHVGLIRNNSLYMWGNSAAGCLGFGPMVTKYSLPQQVELLNNYQVEALSVSCGRNHTLLLTNFSVYSWGSNIYGQLGLSSIVQQSSYPSLVESLTTENIIDISAGQYHSLALTIEGKVYSWGWGVYGQLGHGHVLDVFKPKLINSLSDKVITQICAGHAHSIVLSSEGVVYSFGSNSFGQLGNGTNVKSTIPVQILLNEKIILIASNYFHNLAVAMDNKLYMWGASPQVLRQQVHNYKRIKLTQQYDKNSEPPPPIDWAATTPFSINNNHLYPALIPTDNVEGQIVQVATGCNHSAILTKDGSLYTWGQNFDGQIGNGSRTEVLTPTLVKVNPLNTLNNLNAGISTDADQPLKCTYVSCGAEYTVAVDYTGKVLAWGNNSRAQLGKISDEDDRGIEGKMVVLKTTKRILKIPKTGQNPTDTPKEIPNIPTMHITYRNNDKYPTAFKSNPHFYPLRKIENISTTLKLKNMTFTSRRTLESLDGKHNTETIYIYGQKTLHYALQTYFGFFDTEYILHKCVDYKNYQAASKVSYLDGHFSDSLGFQLTCFKQHMDASKWRQLDDRVEAKKVANAAATATAAIFDGPKVAEQSLSKNVNQVSVISSSCSLESIKQFNDDVYSQGGFEEMCGEELSFLEQKLGKSRDISIDNLKAAAEIVDRNNTKVNLNLKTELIDKLEFHKSKVKKLVEVDISSDLTNLCLNSDSNFDLEPNLNTLTNTTQDTVVEFSNDVIRKTVVNYVESLDVDIINSDGSSIPNITDIYKNNSLTDEFERLCPAVLDSTNLSDATSDETTKTNTNTSTNENANNIIDLASKIVEFYCSRPHILENHILMQNILIKCMQFWLTSNLPVDVLENILLKNMDKYFYPLSILLFCKNFNNNLGEGMVKDSETKKTQKSFEFLKQLSTKFCLQLCSMVLQNVNKA